MIRRHKTIRIKSTAIIIAVVFLVALGLTNYTVFAQSSSETYSVDEVFFGTGGEVDLNSENFSGQGSAGSLGVGEASSENFRAQAGFLTPSEPFLEMVVTSDGVEFGNIEVDEAMVMDARGGDCNCSFTVRTYFSSDYYVLTMSDPPTSENNDIFAAKTVLGAPSTNDSVEEFGLNLVANPVIGVGANPANVPDNNYADGVAASGYSTPEQFKYEKGDIVARSPGDSTAEAVGQTNFTISYMIKASNITPAGYYVMNHDLVVVPTY
jgi:hypothetical protein